MKKKLKNYLENYLDDLRKAGEQLYNETMPELTDELFMIHYETGNRLEYEKVYFARRKQLTVFGMLSILDGKDEDIKKLESVLVDICKEDCWSIPAHVKRYRPEWRITVDLYAAETAFSIAEIISKLKDKLSEDVYNFAYHEVFRRVLTPYIESEKPYDWWEESQINWCAVANGSIGCAALYLIEDKELRDKVISRVIESISHYVDGYTSDGVCKEGISNYVYGLSYYVMFSEMFREYTNGEINLIVTEKFRNIVLFQQKCYYPGNVTLSFSDCRKNEKFRVGLTSYMSMWYPIVKFPDFEMAADINTGYCRYPLISRDYFFTKMYLEHLNTKRSSVVKGIWYGQMIMPEANVSICQSVNDCVLASKGGHNDEPHNHNDVGSFLYISDGEMVLADLGGGEYTRDYFNENRYNHLTCRSLGHNLPLIDGKEQQQGAQYCASNFYADGNGKTVIDIEKAYGLNDDEKITRTMEMDLGNGRVKIEDYFRIYECRSITENLVCLYEPVMEKNRFTIKTPKRTYVVYCPNGIDYNVLKEQYNDRDGKLIDVWLIQWKIPGNRAEIRVEQLV